ncbi:MAG TPA: tetratricopeptide repeat protein [Phycisphaerae bacterium]|nr:tetratricopeptide repeat protein [Phycisphaerae bacterium]
MNRTAFAAVLIAAITLSSTVLLAQQPATRGNAPAPGANQQPGATTAPGTQQPSAAAPQPYYLRPGVYVIPAPYSPTYFSPTIRTYPSLGNPQDPDIARSDIYRSQNGNWGNWNPFPSTYYNGYYYGTGSGWSPYGGDPAAAYEQGRYDADHDYVWYIASQRAGRLLNQWSDQFDDGILRFRDGNYERAAIDMLGAAEKNHADGASRLHAAHALFALGHYTDAARLLERAFELVPSLAYKSYDIREEYGDPADFEQQLEALHAYVVAHPNDVGAVTLLGYVTYFTDGPSTAYPYLRKAARLNPKSYFIPKLLEPARMVSKTDAAPAAAATKMKKDTASQPKPSKDAGQKSLQPRTRQVIAAVTTP